MATRSTSASAKPPTPASQSPAYRQRLDAPSEWTRRNIARFRDTCRTICSVAASLGRGEGAWVETVRLTAECEPEAFRGSLAGSVLPGVLARTGVIGVHLLQGETAASQGGSAEKKLRSQPDQIADWVILIEAIEADALRSARQDAASDAALRRAGAGSSINRGTYRLQFGLTKAELERGSTAPEHWSREKASARGATPVDDTRFTPRRVPSTRAARA